MKIMTILGTRPEIIRLSAVIALLDATEGIDHLLVHTGQNHDYELNGIFFSELALRKPDHFMDAAAGSFGETCARIIAGTEKVLLAHKPDAVLILGDTNSALASIVVKRMHVPLYHMEAGNRCFDFNVPEEINRRIVDHIADFNLVYTEHARRHLLAEGLDQRRIFLTGSPMRQVLDRHQAAFAKSDTLDRLELASGKYLVVSTHREENVDNRKNLAEIFLAVDELTSDLGLPAIVTVHPRTRKRLDEAGLKIDKNRIRLMKPLGFFDYNRLQMDAWCTLSDSGTVAEEAAILGFPAVTIRNAMERPEALDTGSIAITGVNRRRIVEVTNLVARAWHQGKRPSVPEDYCISDTAERVLQLISGTAGLSARWSGVDQPSGSR